MGKKLAFWINHLESLLLKTLKLFSLLKEVAIDLIRDLMD
jgi:hypothetical protein